MRPFLRIVSVVSALTLLTTGVSADALPNDPTVLWSDDSDDCRMSLSETDALGELAECTDITYSTPPETVEQVTSESFEQLQSLGLYESAYPNGAEVASSGPIRDAHATIFSIGPETISHLTADETTRYVAPAGTLRALVDYRIELPDRVETENETTTWVLESTEVDAVRFGVDSEIRERSQSSTPTFRYSLAGRGGRTLWVEARMLATVEKTSTRKTANQTVTETSRTEYQVTVHDSVDVQIYRPSYDVAIAKTPAETGLLAVTASQPYAAYRAAADTDESVRNVWRFYTVGSGSWQTITRTSEAGRETATLQTRPVVVHAYPARTQPSPAPLSRAVRVQADRSTWAKEDAPALPNRIAVGVVDASYRQPETLVTDHSHPLEDVLSIRGLVAGTTTTVDISDKQRTSELRPTTLETTVLSKNETAVVLSVTVRDNTTGDRIRPTRRTDTGGVLQSGGRTYAIDSDGTTTITVPARGISTVSYRPKAWDGTGTTYLPSTERVAFHPLTNLGGWVTLGVDALRASIPFAVVFIAGRRLGQLFYGEEGQW